MEDDIIAAVAAAEAQAAEILQKAEQEAAAIVAEAEKEAMERTKASESACALLAEEIVKRAQQDADMGYRDALEAVQKEASADAEKRMEDIGGHVLAVTGRIVR